MADIKIATVAPIGDGVFADSLTYFTLKDIKPGSLVFVPLRKKKMPAILLSLKPVKDMKSEIKNSFFELKKIEVATEREIFSKEFMSAADKTADYFASSLGQVLNCYLPSNLVKSIENNVEQSGGKNAAEKESPATRLRISEVVQAPEEDRLGFYKSLIREEFAKKNSVFLCLPTIHEISNYSEALKKGIEEYTIIMKPEDSPKKMAQNWTRAVDDTHPLLIIATPLFLSLVNNNFSTIILEKENSSAYRNFGRPFIDNRYFIEELANNMAIRLIIGDTVLRLATLYKKESEIYPASLLFKHRLIGKAKNTIINMKEEKTGMVKAVGGDLINLIKSSIAHKNNILLLSARKGLANTTVCRDCKNIVICKKCNGSISLHKGEKSNVYSCHRCNIKSDTNVLCEKCRSWNLKTLGFGTEKIGEEIKDKFKGAKVYRLDGEVVTKYRQGKQIMDDFLKNKGAILIGTEMALFYLQRPIENVAIVSIDSMFAIPDFKTNERLFNYLTCAKLSAENNFLVQTRAINNPIFEKAAKGDTLQFYRDEIVARRNYDYPPFKIFIKITCEGRREDIEKEFEQLATYLKRWNPEIFKSSNQASGKSKMNILLKINPLRWPDKKEEGAVPDDGSPSLFELLRSLPPKFLVRVEPESIL